MLQHGPGSDQSCMQWVLQCCRHSQVVHAAPEEGPLQASAALCSHSSLQQTKMWRGLSSFPGKLQNCETGTGPVSHFAAWEVSTRMWRVTIFWPLIGHWVPKQAFSLVELCNPDTGTGWPMFRCFGKAVRSWGDVCTLRVTNHGRSDGLYHGITIWHTNILSQHNINQPTAEKWLQKWLLGNGKAWCQPDCSLRPHIICSITRQPVQPASFSQPIVFPQKMAKWCIRVQTASHPPCQQLGVFLMCRALGGGGSANMTNHPQVVKLVRHIIKESKKMYSFKYFFFSFDFYKVQVFFSKETWLTVGQISIKGFMALANILRVCKLISIKANNKSQ